MKFFKKIAATGLNKDKDLQGEENPFLLTPDKSNPPTLSKDEIKRASEAVQTYIKDSEIHITELKQVLKSKISSI